MNLPRLQSDRLIQRIAGFLAAVCCLVVCFGETRLFAIPKDNLQWTTRTWRSDTGLPDDDVRDLVQSGDGYLWVATYRAVFRFDGIRFVPMMIPNVPLSGRNRCRVLYAAHDGSVWAGLEHGAVVRWQKNGQTNIWNEAIGMGDDLPTSICETKNGSVFIGFRSGKIAEISNDQVMIHAAVKVSRRGGASCVAADADGKLWCGAGRSLMRFQDGLFIEMQSLPGNETRAIYPAKGGGFWVQQNRAIYHCFPGQGFDRTIFIPSGYATTSVFHEDRMGRIWVGLGFSGSSIRGAFRAEGDQLVSIGLEYFQITALKEDHEGNIWIGTTEDGIKKLRPQLMRYIGPEPRASDGRINSFAKDPSGKVWVVMDDHNVMSLNGDSWESAKSSYSLREARANSLDAAPDGSVVVGSYRGLLRYQNDQVVPIDMATPLPRGIGVSPVFYSRSGDLWYSQWIGKTGRVRDGKAEEWNVPEVSQFVDGPKGEVLLGSTRGRIFRIGDAGVQEVPFPGAGEFEIHNICCDPNGTIWLALFGGGLARIKGNQFIRVTAKDGLADDFVAQLLLDDLGRLWINSLSGISRVDSADFDAFAQKRTKRLRVMYFAHGEEELAGPGKVRNSGTCCRRVGSELWFSVGNRIVAIDPNSRPLNWRAPPVVIESVRVDQKELLSSPGSGALLKLEPSHSRLEIGFTALSYDSPENNQFRYMLENYDDDWIDGGTNRQAIYSRLGPGTYRFHVIACNGDGVWSEAGPGIPFSVSPFFWQTVWFRLAILCAAVAAGVTASRHIALLRVRKRIEALERERALTVERTRIARDMHDQLGASLTQLALIGDMGKNTSNPEEHNRHYNRVSLTARESLQHLNELVWAVNPKHDTLSAMITYMERNAAELLRIAGIRCFFDIPDELPNIPIAAAFRHNLVLAVRESINNLVKHSSATEAWLRVALDGTLLRIEVQDNGAGLPVNGNPAPSPLSGGNGLLNMGERMHTIHGRFQHFSAPNQGTTLVFEVSLETS